MATTNKGFNYVLNTSTEDHNISKKLSGHDATTTVELQKLKSFDSQPRIKIDAAQRLLFATCQPAKIT